MKWIFTLLSFTFLSLSYATTFVPIDFERQLRSTDGAILGIYKSHQYRQLPSGEVVTEASFEVKKSAGFPNSQVYSPDNFKVIYPGGSWKGMDYSIAGSPEFEAGKTYLLLLQKTSFGAVLNNFTLGKYVQEVKRDGVYFRSAVFPHSPELGLMRFEDLQDYFSQSFGHKLHVKNETAVNSHIATGHQSFQRSPASAPSQNYRASRTPSSAEQHQRAQSYSFIWIIFLFFILGFYGALKRKKR